MPFYSDELIEEVRSRNDIVDVISQYVHLQRKGSSYFGLCPFHNEKTGSFSVTPAKQMFYCFGCGEGGNVFSFLMKHENYTFQEAMQELADRAGIELPKQNMTRQQQKEADKRSRLLEVHKEAATYFYRLLRDSRGQRAFSYFKERQLSKETMKQFGLGYSDKYSNDLYKYLKSKGYEDELLKDSGLVSFDEKRGAHDKFWNRAMFPIMDANAKVVAFGGRVMGDGEPKYLNSPETMIFNKSRTLYGLHLAKKTKRQQFILCEGYMDVIALHQAGFDNAVASLGTALTAGHANMMKRYTKEVYLSYDSDAAGTKAALRAIPILKEAGITCKIISMQPYKDPDEFIKSLGREEYENRIKEAENSFMFSIRMLQNEYDLKDPEAKTKFFEEVADRIKVLPEEIERDNYCEAVSEKYGVSVTNLKKLVTHRATKEGIVASKTKERKTGLQRLDKKEDGMKKSQSLLLTWLVEDEALYPAIEPYIDEMDFEEGIYRKVAHELFMQLQAGEKNPAKIVSMFHGEDDVQNEVAKIFNTSVGELAEKSLREKAVKETILRMKERRLNEEKEKMKTENSSTSYEQLLESRRKLEEMKKMTIHL